ncbi:MULTISPECIES: polyheme membrane-associated cytochrome C [unclassified Roseitalea]|uniref:polyheme membrane-associated cytochrome C n=1 Tax=unclassified Roseitalea TaxID=2639107 RepID=UPI00273F1476|nr:MULTISPECIES: polyheme membrane-associated cytochrome C [unclassified Roseitalea]
MFIARLLLLPLALVFAGTSPLAAQDNGAGPPGAQALESLSDFTEAWLRGPHASYRSPSFTHWNEDGEIPARCAACHSETGFLDWLGADGSAPLAVDHPATINTVIGCASCHVSEAEALDAVPFPSTVTVTGLGASATCTLCHQGLASTDTVVAATDGMDPDAVSEDLSFINVHYGIAAAVMHGAETRGGYQYDGRSYAGRFTHVPSANSCVACHEPHTTEVATEGCLACHQGVDDITDIRTRHADFDGDGNAAGGIAEEIAGLHAMLYEAIRAYAGQVAGSPIGYHPDSYPYFFIDSDGDGTIGESEAVYPNQYANWTPRLVKAAYNYQVVAKDKGAWVHHPQYALQLLHDSLESLSQSVDVDMAGLTRP